MRVCTYFLNFNLQLTRGPYLENEEPNHLFGHMAVSQLGERAAWWIDSTESWPPTSPDLHEKHLKYNYNQCVPIHWNNPGR